MIFVYPGFDALYYSFYLEGLSLAAGSREVVFATEGFPSFGSHGLAIAIGNDHSNRIFISASDGPVLNQAALEWCDYYAKVNLDPSIVPPPDKSRVLAIGPSFPVKVWSPLRAWFTATANFARCNGTHRSPKEHFANYRRQYLYRRAERDYCPGPVDQGYVFFASTLWQEEHETNQRRAAFVEACQSLNELRLEGGFAPRRSGRVQGYDHLLAPRRYSLDEYLENTKRSVVVFNTPAVSSCHGWKLAEFLALGKAIISTPLKRALPAPLRHGEHVHFVNDGISEIREAIRMIQQDKRYRKSLEASARKYYTDFLSPRRVIERIFEVAGIEVQERAFTGSGTEAALKNLSIHK